MKYPEQNIYLNEFLFLHYFNGLHLFNYGRENFKTHKNPQSANNFKTFFRLSRFSVFKTP